MIDNGNDIKVTTTMEHEDVPIKHEPKDLKNSATIDKCYYEHFEVIIDDKLNKKDLLKIDSITLKDKDQTFS
eukprot:13833486-Ditylum_brightwellii.AAC.1